MKILKKDLVYKGLIFKVWRETYQFGEKSLNRDVVEFPETCAVLPLVDESSAILIYQYRFPIKRELLEIPAGKIDPGETPEEAAKRELMEEIKMKPNKLIKIGTFVLTPGYSTERIHLFLGLELEYAPLQEDEGEEIKTIKITLNTLLEMLKRGEVEDAKTYITLMYYFNFYKKL